MYIIAVLQRQDHPLFLRGDHEGLGILPACLDAAQTFKVAVIFHVGEAFGACYEPVAPDRFLPQGKALRADFLIKVGVVAGGILPVFRKDQFAEVRGAGQVESGCGCVEPGIFYDAVASRMVLV